MTKYKMHPKMKAKLKSYRRRKVKLLKGAACVAMLLAAIGCHTNMMPRTTVNHYHNGTPGDLPPLPDDFPSMAMNLASPIPAPSDSVTDWPAHTLAWDYAQDSAWFRVYGGQKPDRSDWTALGETQAHEFALPRWQQGYFGVKAFRYDNGLESDWGTAQQ